MRDLIDRPQMLAQLSVGARAHASRFGWSATVDRLLDLYSGVMSHTPAPVEA